MQLRLAVKESTDKKLAHAEEELLQQLQNNSTDVSSRNVLTCISTLVCSHVQAECRVETLKNPQLKFSQQENLGDALTYNKKVIEKLLPPKRSAMVLLETHVNPALKSRNDHYNRLFHYEIKTQEEMKKEGSRALKMMFEDQHIKADNPGRIFLEGLLEDDETINKLLKISAKLSQKGGNNKFHTKNQLSPMKSSLFSDQPVKKAVASVAAPSFSDQGAYPPIALGPSSAKKTPNKETPKKKTPKKSSASPFNAMYEAAGSMTSAGKKKKASNTEKIASASKKASSSKASKE
ncbi:MAG: hypothetical protein SGILL_003956 [Bacillariaceae sp.]